MEYIQFQNKNKKKITYVGTFSQKIKIRGWIEAGWILVCSPS